MEFPACSRPRAKFIQFVAHLLRRSRGHFAVPHGWLLVLATICSVVVASAQSVPKLDKLSSIWFQRGTTNEVSLVGDSLGSLSSVLFTGSGISGSISGGSQTPVTLEASVGGLVFGQADKTKSRSIQIVIGTDATFGPHELRAASVNGVSNPLTINVSDLPEFTEITPNNQATNAPFFLLPAAISGIVTTSAESDYFRFRAKAGEKIIFDVQANRFGSPLDPTLVIQDAMGKELAKSEDVNGLDPFIEFTPPADGEYAAKIFDLRFQGGGDYRYRILAGSLPYLEYLFPFGGKRGTSVDLQLDGRNLDGTGKMVVMIASDAPLGRQEVRARTPHGYSNPQPFEVGDLNEIAESEPNNDKDKANSFTPPVVINGRINEAKDIDYFRLKSPSDQKWVIEVQARRAGSPLDSLLTLMDSQGKVLQRNDDSDGPDAKIEFDAKKDTEYLLSIRDLTDRGGNRFGYRMTVRAPNTSPDFAVKASGGRFRVNRGGRIAVRCEVERRNGFDGIVRITADNLPSGVTASTLVLGSQPRFGWVILSAASDASLGYSPLKFSAWSEASGKAILRMVEPAEQGWLTVLPTTPFTVDVADASVTLDQNANASASISITRREGYTGEIKISGEGPPGIDTPAVTIGAGQSRAKLQLNAKYDAEIGTFPLLVKAEGNGDDGIVQQVAPSIPAVSTRGIAMFLTAMLPGSSFFRTDLVRLSAVALPTNSVSSANQTEFVVKVDRRGLSGEIALSLEDLPTGVSAVVTNILASANEASIKLLVSDKAEAGKEHKFRVTGSATYNDRIWRQKTQDISLLVTAPEKEAAAASPPPTPTPSPSK